VALALPVLGSILITQRVLRTTYARANAWSAGSVRRRAVVVAGAALAAAGAAWAWWPSGQYRPVRPTDRGTLISFSHAIASPVSTLRPVTPVDAVLTPGTHLAVSMVPVNGATRQHPALFVIAGRDGKPSVALLLSRTRAPVVATHLAAMHGSTTTAAPPLQAATAFPFKLPAKPGPGDSQALSVNTTDGGVTYDVAYSLVTVSGGGPVTNQNSAYAFASCTACKTVAVSFQVVLIVGQSNVIAPINAAGSLNANCPACVTVAIADQLVVTLTKQPPQQLVDELNAALAKLNAIPALGAGGTPAEIASEVQAVQTEIENDLSASGLLAHPVGSSSPTPTSGTSPTAGAQPTPTTTRTAPTTTATTTSPPTTTSSSASTGAGPTTTAPTTTNAPTTTSAASTDQTTTAGTTAPATTTTGG
jgi:putative peptide zinc metalloprotease protein